MIKWVCRGSPQERAKSLIFELNACFPAKLLKRHRLFITAFIGVQLINLFVGQGVY